MAPEDTSAELGIPIPTRTSRLIIARTIVSGLASGLIVSLIAVNIDNFLTPPLLWISQHSAMFQVIYRSHLFEYILVVAITQRRAFSAWKQLLWSGTLEHYQATPEFQNILRAKLGIPTMVFATAMTTTVTVYGIVRGCLYGGGEFAGKAFCGMYAVSNPMLTFWVLTVFHAITIWFLALWLVMRIVREGSMPGVKAVVPMWLTSAGIPILCRYLEWGWLSDRPVFVIQMVVMILAIVVVFEFRGRANPNEVALN
ncbi:MAG: hypothetical protein K1X53_05665 [Candidatus Sumerlaeaceae bacterium]|nr:hypothetical protein [Candidatus Sumerlaeaceae bacterium]